MTMLLEKLLEIERSLGRVDPLTMRGMLMEAQAEALRMEQELIGALAEIHQLREDARHPAPRARGARHLAGAQIQRALPKVS